MKRDIRFRIKGQGFQSTTTDWMTIDVFKTSRKALEKVFEKTNKESEADSEESDVEDCGHHESAKEYKARWRSIRVIYLAVLLSAMGLGKLKNHQVKLNIDSSVPPVAQPQRRIPFHIRKKVKVAIKELESQGIIEKVPDSQPTPWQHLQGMAGVQNIADDILVFGSTRQEHDQALENCLKRLKEKGLTLNKSKCSFLNTELEFFGQIFSEQGTRPDPRKTQDVIDAAIPQNVSELRSFLGMVSHLHGNKSTKPHSTS
eukprot:gene91-9704_t